MTIQAAGPSINTTYYHGMGNIRFQAFPRTYDPTHRVFQGMWDHRGDTEAELYDIFPNSAYSRFKVDQDRAASKTPQLDRIDMTLGPNASAFKVLDCVIGEDDILIHTKYIRNTMIPRAHIAQNDS